VNTAGLEGPKWVSRWASLADSYAEGASPPSVGESLEGELCGIFLLALVEQPWV